MFVVLMVTSREAACTFTVPLACPGVYSARAIPAKWEQRQGEACHSSCTTLTVIRSSTITLAYLMVQMGLTAARALLYLQSVRGCANPNSGFRNQLEEFQVVRICWL